MVHALIKYIYISYLHPGDKLPSQKELCQIMEVMGVVKNGVFRSDAIPQKQTSAIPFQLKGNINEIKFHT